MFWQDVLLDYWQGEAELARALAAALGVQPEAVLVVDELAPSLDVDAIAVLAERSRREGDFPLQLTIFIRDAELAERVQSFASTQAVVRRLAEETGSACLITGPETDPEADFVTYPDGRLERVILDEELLDDEVRVLAGTPLTPADALPRVS